MKIVLDTEDLRQAWELATLRSVESHRRNLKKYATMKPKDQFCYEVTGAMGEIAAAKALGLRGPDGRWLDGGVNREREGDLGKLEVRAAAGTNGQLDRLSLIVRPRDKKDVPYILVVGAYDTWYLKGWILGRDARQDEFWEAKGFSPIKAWFVPQDALNPMETLPI